MLNLFLDRGKVAEWSNAVAWKAAVVQATAGSNPVLSAKNYILKNKPKIWLVFFIFI